MRASGIIGAPGIIPQAGRASVGGAVSFGTTTSPAAIRWAVSRGGTTVTGFSGTVAAGFAGVAVCSFFTGTRILVVSD
jgi:hypothetical protein